MALNVDMHLLRAFITVSEVGSISRAADRLARTQAAVSMQLQRLEKELDANLLRRSTRGVSLTDAGEILLAYARKAMASGEQLRRQINGSKVEGRINLGMVEDLAVTRLPTLLAEFRNRFPLVELDLSSGNSSDLSQSLKEGRCDLVIADPARFTSTPALFYSRQLVWCASRMLDLDDDAELPLVMFDALCSWQDRMLTGLAEANRRWRATCHVSTPSALTAALRAGLGVSVLMHESVPADCQIIDGQVGLPVAPRAEFGLFAAEDASESAIELLGFLKLRLGG